MNYVLVFPGQGSQNVGMAKDIAENFTEFSSTLEEASDCLQYNMANLLFQDEKKQLNLTEYTQPALVTVSTGIYRILQKRTDIKAQLVAGHSLGEYSALVALGTLSFTDALKAVQYRGQMMQKAVPIGIGAMAAYIGSKLNDVQNICKNISNEQNIVEIVNFNSPQQAVISGHKETVLQVINEVKANNLGKMIELPVSAPFHSSLMKPASLLMAEYLNNITMSKFSGQIVANIDALAYDENSYTKKHLVKQIDNPVLWTQSVHKLNELSTNNAIWIECGYGSILQGLIKKTNTNINIIGTSNLEQIKKILSINN